MNKLLSILSILFLCSACKQFLDVKPQDFTSPNTYYTNQQELEAALAGVYDPLRNVYDVRLSLFFPFGNDEACTKESAPGKQVYFYDFDAGHLDIREAWTQLYKGIDNANTLLENADKADCPPEVITYIKGEALFLRAYYHFLLTAYWGDVPLRLQSTKSAQDASLRRSPSAEVYQQVMTDMEQSLDMVRDISEIGFGGRVSKSAVKGILARIYLNAAGRLNKPEYYERARNWALSLMNDHKHSLNASYSDIFIKLMQDKYDINESIFEVECYGNTYSNDQQETGGFVSYLTPAFGQVYVKAGDVSIARGRGTFYVTPHYYNLFNEHDTRRDWTISPYFWKNVTATGFEKEMYHPEFKFRWPGKFRREYEINLPVYAWGNSTNFPLLRYADVLLMFAEADNAVHHGSTAESLEAVNRVKRRAFGFNPLVSVPEIDEKAMDENELLSYIQDERARELGFESQRKLDLLRWGIFFPKMEQVGAEIASIPEKVPNPNAAGSMINNPEIYQPGSGFPGGPTGPSIIARTYTNVSAKYALMPIPELEMSSNTEINENNPGW